MGGTLDDSNRSQDSFSRHLQANVHGNKIDNKLSGAIIANKEEEVEEEEEEEEKEEEEDDDEDFC